MLIISIAGQELFDEEANEFKQLEDFELELEHSLLSLSKWESKFQKPFLGDKPKSTEELMAYIEAMILNPVYPKDLWSRFGKTEFDAINAYLESSQSATTFGVMPKTPGRGEVVTAELIYYWMVAFNIPFECERWHLNRLFALIRICNIKQGKQKKMGRQEIAQRNRELNAQRRAEHNTRG